MRFATSTCKTLAGRRTNAVVLAQLEVFGLGDIADAGPDAGAVRHALAALLASESFRDAPQLRAFLSYIVAETLEGRGGELKGYSIATMALSRPESFDPQTDPIVRVQAGRLRQALAEYHAANPQASLIIRLERGSYVPLFEFAGAAPVPESATIPTTSPPIPSSAVLSRRLVAGLGAMALVLAGIGLFLIWPGAGPAPPREASGAVPLRAEAFYPSLIVEADQSSRDNGTGLLVTRLREALARFDDLVVVAESDATDMTAATRSPGLRPPGRDLLLRVTGQPIAHGMIRFGARLLDRGDNRVVWSREFDPAPADAGGDEARLSIVRNVATTIAQPYGVIHAHVRARADSALSAADPYGCLVSGFDYWHTNDRATHAAARNCLIDRVRDHPGNAALHAQLAYLHLEEFRHGYNPLPGDPLTRAIDSAQTAVRLAPTSARSHQALLAARFSRRDTEGAWRAAEDALRLNPFDSDIMADVAARHIQSGRFDKGLAMLGEAFRMNAAPPIWASTYAAIALYMLGRIDEASTIATQLESARLPTSMVATLLVAYNRRDAARARERLTLLRTIHPAIASDMAGYLNRLNVSDLLLERVMASYDAAVSWTDAQNAP